MISRKAIFELADALGGIPILGTLAGSPAARAGIRYGDVVLAVNNRRTRTMIDYLEAKALRSDGMEVVVFRAGAERIERLEYSSEAPPSLDAAHLLAELIGMRLLPFDGSEPPGDD